jgi:hypothetical protein
LGAPLTSPALGELAIPPLADTDRRLAVLLGLTGYQLSLGRSTGSAQASRNTGDLGLAVGLMRQVTFVGRMSIVKTWNRQDLTIAAATGDAGVNPADPSLGDAAGAQAAQLFTTNFDNALATLESRIASGAYDGDPATRALAEQTLSSGRQLADSLSALLVDPASVAAFLPLSTSIAGSSLSARVTEVQATLSGPLGVTGFADLVPLPVNAATADDVRRYATVTGGPIGYDRFTSSEVVGPGDVSLGAVFTPIDRWDAQNGRGVRFAVEGTVRLPTGATATPDDALGAAAGAGVVRIEGLGALDFGWGVLGGRLHGGFATQRSGTFERRVAAPVEVLVPAARTATVRQSGGGEWRIGLAPHLRVARFFGLQVSGSYAQRSALEFSYATAADSVPGIPASLLGESSAASRMELGFGAIYSSSGRREDGTSIRPLDAGWTWRMVVASSGGIQTRWSAMQVYFRYYAKFF